MPGICNICMAGSKLKHFPGQISEGRVVPAPSPDDSAPLQTQPRAPRLLQLPSSTPQDTLKTRSINCPPFLARSCGRSLSFWVQGQCRRVGQWRRLVFKEALGEASGSLLCVAGRHFLKSAVVGREGFSFGWWQSQKIWCWQDSDVFTMLF